MTGKSVTWTRSTRPAAINARFIDRLPCERSGTSDSSLSLATTSTASPATTVASGQSSEQPVRIGPEDHPLLQLVQGKPVVEKLRSLLPPITSPIGAGGPIAVEAG